AKQSRTAETSTLSLHDALPICGSQREGEADATLAELAMLLTDAERSALAGSAVFHGGFTRDAAEAVVGMDLALLSALLDRSLLRSEEHTSELQSRENLVCRLLL